MMSAPSGIPSRKSSATKATKWNCTASDGTGSVTASVNPTLSTSKKGTKATIKGVTPGSATVKIYSGSTTAGQGTLVKTINVTVEKAKMVISVTGEQVTETYDGENHVVTTNSTLFDFAAEKLGGIDLYISNAGFAYYEKIAREKLGYAYPDEKVFVDISGS